MELNSARLEASSRIQERPFENPAEHQGRHAPRRQKDDAPVTEDESLAPNELESHEVDDLA